MNERDHERKFYHDLLNLVSSVRGISEVINDVDEKTRAEMLALLGTLSESMIETIHARRLYCNLIAHDLKTVPASVDCERLCQRLSEIYTRHTLAESKHILLAPVQKSTPTQKTYLFTDKDLLLGALGYGIRAALEAITSGQSVTLGLTSETRKGTHVVDFSITFPYILSDAEADLVFKTPRVTGSALTGHAAHVFHTLITEGLKGSVRLTTARGTITLHAQFEETC